MAKRPLGVILACAVFALMGLGSLLAGLQYGTVALPSSAPQSVRTFLAVFPLFLLVFGSLGLAAPVLLWAASPWGRRLGLACAALWILEEAAIAAWATRGPRVVRRASGGLADTAIRVAVGGILFAYLWTVGARYVEDTI